MTDSTTASVNDRERLPHSTRALARAVKWLEGYSPLDRWQRLPNALADALLSSPRQRDLLRGAWLGHAAHPLLTDFPLGMWASATFLDLAGGRQSRPAAQRLLAAGLLTAVPTALTGVAEWGDTRGPDRRIGLVHALGNTAALGLYGASLARRRQGRHAQGVALGLAGGLVATASGYLGGHLTLSRKVASPHPEFDEEPQQ